MNQEESQKLIIEMIRDFKTEIREVRLDMRAGFEQVDKRFEQVETRLGRIEGEVRADRDKLQKVYEARDKVKITFGWQWGMVSLFIATIAAGITQIFG